MRPEATGHQPGEQLIPRSGKRRVALATAGLHGAIGDTGWKRMRE